MSWTGKWRLEHGDCRELLAELADESIDSIVTDPPYEISFMNKKWDADGSAHDIDVWRECLRVLKPGGHLLAFGATRTYHRLTVAIEDAGFEIRDSIHWLTGSGFPKSLNVSAAIDKAAGAEREVVGRSQHSAKRSQTGKHAHGIRAVESERLITAPATDAAKQWDGWGTALKPACEVIVMARKPFKTTVAENVLTHGTGAINIDGCRIGNESRHNDSASRNDIYGQFKGVETRGRSVTGRWPANVILDEYAAARLDADNDPSRSRRGKPRANKQRPSPGDGWGMPGVGAEYDDEGGPSRFFYVAKTSRSEREVGLERAQARQRDDSREAAAPGANNPRNRGGQMRANHHPCVKPISLMRYLCRLVTPPHGVVLDPFTGSGSTGVAARLERFEFIGFERDAEYVEIARARLEHWDRQGDLFGDAL